MDLILEKLPDALRQRLEVKMLGDNYESKFERRMYERGKLEGRGRGLQDAVIHILRGKLAALSADEEAKVRGISEPDALLALNTALALAIEAADVRALIDALPPPPPPVEDELEL